MPEKKKSRGSQNAGLQHENILEAVVVADSFDDRFSLVTDHRAQSLLPVANQPILSYTLEFLASNGVKHIYIYSCHCSDHVKCYLQGSKWNKPSSPCSVSLVVSSGLSSIGDVLRDIDQKSLFESDFLLVPGDIVSNGQLKEALEEHKVRREKDKNKPLMTLILQQLSPSHQSRSAENDVVIAADKNSKRVLHYQKFSEISKTIHFPLSIFHSTDHAVELHYDFLDTGMWICSPQVPQLFTDNFDYQTQFDFIKGILINEEFLGNQIHLHVLKRRYCARVHNLLMYDTISRDVIARWSYPFVPELMNEDETPDHAGERYKLLRHNVYVHPTCVLGHNSVVSNNSIVGVGTVVGKNCRISNSVIGNNCSIEENCELTGAYVWNNVTIKNGCKITNALICDDVVVHEKVTFEKGAILCDKVSVGPSTNVPSNTVICFNKEDDFGDVDENRKLSPDIIGDYGKGYVWKRDDEDCEDSLSRTLWGLSLREHVETVANEADESASDVSSLAALSDGEVESGEDDVAIDDDVSNFQREVKESLQGGYMEKAQCDNLILEVNSSKYAYNVSMKDVIETITKSLFEIAASEQSLPYFASLKKVIEFFVPLLCNYNKNITAQLDCLYAIEEHAASHENVASCLVKIFMVLYDQDVLSEEAIMHWNSKPDISYLAMLTPHEIRAKVSKFIQWLQEAEEEDSDE